MAKLEQHYHVDYSDIPREIIDYDDLSANEEWNNYSSYRFQLEDPENLDDYDLKYGRFGLKGGDLKEFWRKMREWLTGLGLPEDVNEIYFDVFW